ncbi:glyoxylate reductase/hydroxypyruvate reductase-like isoform X1 [Hyalella azteca]|uniref:Glyoxylate reductase/hydroxypyruvate reductase-like isoform X1 n=1 Tax=Hyalella azteca TaxID=294128 RepID=A0A8B7N4S9_HYAAZ|nr:glyoxylate reductase/hydroxypyruvate reductase-like isoform X1 [Hyalella azteca]
MTFSAWCVLLRYQPLRICKTPRNLNFFKPAYSTSLPDSMEKPKVLITRNDVPQIAIRKLRELCDVDIYEGSYPMPRDQLLARVAGKDGLFCFLTDRINAEVLDAAGRSLRVVSTMSVGYDHLSLEEMKSRDIKVGYTPDVLTDATAELTLALLLATSRRLLQANAELNNGGWGRCVWGPVWMLGKGLSGSTVGIFGLGRTGQAVLKRLAGFNVAKFLYTSTTKKELRAKFNKDAFAAMKNSAVFINTSRGGLVDQEALVWALQTGQIWAAGLDVMTPEPLPTDHILTTLPNCTLLPHIGSSEEGTRVAMAELAADNLLGGLLEDKEMPQRLC